MIIFDFLEVPGGLDRLPWVPGAPLGGSLGGVPAQTALARTGRASVVLASFFISISMSIFDRLGVDLGSVSGGHFWSFWRLGRPKLVPKPSSNRLSFEKVIVHETV